MSPKVASMMSLTTKGKRFRSIALMYRAMRVNNPARQNVSVSVFMSYIFCLLWQWNKLRQNVLRIKEILPTAIALYFLKKGHVGAHTQAGSPIRGNLELLYPGHLDCFFMGCKQTTNANACLADSHSI